MHIDQKGGEQSFLILGYSIGDAKQVEIGVTLYV